MSKQVFHFITKILYQRLRWGSNFPPPWRDTEADVSSVRPSSSLSDWITKLTFRASFAPRKSWRLKHQLCYLFKVEIWLSLNSLVSSSSVSRTHQRGPQFFQKITFRSFISSNSFNYTNDINLCLLEASGQRFQTPWEVPTSLPVQDQTVIA